MSRSAVDNCDKEKVDVAHAVRAQAVLGLGDNPQ